MPAAASFVRFIGLLIRAAEILFRLFVECLLASGRTEIINLALVLRFQLRRFLVNLHLANRIDGHNQLLSLPCIRFTGGIYCLNISESVTTVTELIAIAKPAYSGLKVMSNAGISAPAATGINAEL